MATANIRDLGPAGGALGEFGIGLQFIVEAGPPGGNSSSGRVERLGNRPDCVSTAIDFASSVNP